MNNNSMGLILGVVVGLVLGGFGGYLAGEKSASAAGETQVAELTAMMKSDGDQMVKMGGMMMAAGQVMETSGEKYHDDVLTMMGKDLSASGMKHEADGKSMTEGDMMGMSDMPGMDHSGMKM